MHFVLDFILICAIFVLLASLIIKNYAQRPIGASKNDKDIQSIIPGLESEISALKTRQNDLEDKVLAWQKRSIKRDRDQIDRQMQQETASNGDIKMSIRKQSGVI